MVLLPWLSATPAGLVEVLRRAPAGTDEEGVAGPAQVAYVAVPGPQYETAAEVGVLRALGGDVVGMSTAVELQAAIDEGLETAVLTVVTNAAGVADEGAGARRICGRRHASVHDRSSRCPSAPFPGWVC